MRTNTGDQTYVALLRGINVGGKNLIRMPALKACFEAQGLRDVSTYIQSGNVLFTTGRSKPAFLTRQIESAVSAAFPYECRLVLRSFPQMQAIVSGAPKWFGDRPTQYRDDVIFLRDSLTAEQAMTSVTTTPGVDRAIAGDGVVYFSRLIARASQSRLSRIVGTPAYQHMTIRNWNTTRKLIEMMERLHG